MGAAAWAVLMFGGGYWLGAIPVVASNLGLILLSTVAVSALPGLVTLLRRRAKGRPDDQSPTDVTARPALSAI